MSDDRYQNGSVEKAFLILEKLATHSEPVSLVKLATETGINKTTLFRFLSVLGKLGYVWKSGDGDGYSTGTRFFQLGMSTHLSSILRTIVHPFLVDLSAQVRESVHLGLLEGEKVFYCDKVESDHSLRMITKPGLSLDAHGTGVGKAMLSQRPLEEVQKLYQNRTLVTYTPHTITSTDKLIAELEKIRRLGYSLDNEEFEVGLRCVAMPVPLTRLRRSVGISISGPTFRMTEENIARMIPLLRSTTAAVSQALEESGQDTFVTS